MSINTQVNLHLSVIGQKCQKTVWFEKLFRGMVLMWNLKHLYWYIGILWLKNKEDLIKKTCEDLITSPWTFIISNYCQLVTLVHERFFLEYWPKVTSIEKFLSLNWNASFIYSNFNTFFHTLKWFLVCEAMW